MPEVKAGDRVRVTYEGEVVSSPLAGESFRIRDMLGRTSTHRDVAPSFVKIEVIEPAYEAGKVYEDANGMYFMRLVSGRWQTFEADVFVHDFPRRPLRKLIPEGDN